VVAVVSARGKFGWSSADDHWVEWLIGLILLTWGVTLAVSGLGLGHTPTGRAIDTYWPLAFMAYGLWGIVGRLVRRRGDVFLSVAVLVAGAAVTAGNIHLEHVNGWTLVWAGLILLIGLEILVPRSKNPRRRHRHWDLGDLDIQLGDDVDPTAANRHHTMLLGDIRLDLSEVALPDRETTWTVSGVIGDITVLVPRDLPVDLEAEVRVGDITLFSQRADGIGRRLYFTSPGYAEATRKVAIRVTLVVGDITIMRY